MESIYRKILSTIFIWLTISCLIFTSVTSNSDSDYEHSIDNSAEDAFLSPSSKFYVTKKLSEFLGGPGKKRFGSYYPNYYVSKKLSEFLGGPGRKRFDASKHSVDKKLSEFLGGPGRR